MTAFIFHVESLTVYGVYNSEGMAVKALRNAVEKGWKLQGRKYMPVTLNSLTVATKEAHAALDYDIVVTYPGSDPVRFVTMKKSVEGTYMDPTTETYMSA